MKKVKFGGAAEKRTSLLGGLEKKFVDKYTPKIPKFLETYTLTLLTIPFGLLAIWFGYLAKSNLNYLWLISLMILLQYITDVFDGAVGRYRNTGLIKWGYYMDHFLDYFFLGCIIIAYALILPNLVFPLLIILAVFGAFMVNSFLIFGATNKFPPDFFRISPTEIRPIVIILNTIWIFIGNAYATHVVYTILIASLLALIFTIYNSSKNLWKIDKP